MLLATVAQRPMPDGFFIMRAIRALLIVTFLSVSLAAGPAFAEWQEDLAYQIEFETGCLVAFLSEVVEREVEGRQVILAKVHCEDRRTFDAVREDALEPFKFHQCEAPDVKTC